MKYAITLLSALLFSPIIICAEELTAPTTNRLVNEKVENKLVAGVKYGGIALAGYGAYEGIKYLIHTSPPSQSTLLTVASSTFNTNPVVVTTTINGPHSAQVKPAQAVPSTGPIAPAVASQMVPQLQQVQATQPAAAATQAALTLAH